MKKWGTTIHALDPIDGEYKEFSGPIITAPSRKLAFDYCQKNGLGYCPIIDELILLVPNKEGIPDWKNKIDFTLDEKN
jgi:hypothetical protein